MITFEYNARTPRSISFSNKIIKYYDFFLVQNCSDFICRSFTTSLFIIVFSVLKSFRTYRSQRQRFSSYRRFQVMRFNTQKLQAIIFKPVHFSLAPGELYPRRRSPPLTHCPRRSGVSAYRHRHAADASRDPYVISVVSVICITYRYILINNTRTPHNIYFKYILYGFEIIDVNYTM